MRSNTIEEMESMILYHNAEAHMKANSIGFVDDCAECWRERFTQSMIASHPELGDHDASALNALTRTRRAMATRSEA